MFLCPVLWKRGIVKYFDDSGTANLKAGRMVTLSTSYNYINDVKFQFIALYIFIKWTNKQKTKKCK